MNLDAGNHSHYDPDEILEEQRDRQLRKKLNFAFKDFAAKISKVLPSVSGECSVVPQFYARVLAQYT